MGASATLLGATPRLGGDEELISNNEQGISNSPRRSWDPEGAGSPMNRAPWGSSTLLRLRPREVGISTLLQHGGFLAVLEIGKNNS